MKQKLIKLSEIHYIVVDDSVIKKESFVFQQNFEKTNNQIIKIETEFQAHTAGEPMKSMNLNKKTAISIKEKRLSLHRSYR